MFRARSPVSSALRFGARVMSATCPQAQVLCTIDLYTRTLRASLCKVKCHMQSSVPLSLVHETITHGTIFECSNKVSIASATSWPPPGTSGRINIAIGRGRIVCWARLQPDRCIRIEMTCNSLNRSRNTSLLLIHRGCTLSPSPRCCLRIQTLLRGVM